MERVIVMQTFMEFMEQVWVWPLLFTVVMALVVYRSWRKRPR